MPLLAVHLHSHPFDIPDIGKAISNECDYKAFIQVSMLPSFSCLDFKIREFALIKHMPGIAVELSRRARAGSLSNPGKPAWAAQAGKPGLHC